MSSSDPSSNGNLFQFLDDNDTSCLLLDDFKLESNLGADFGLDDDADLLFDGPLEGLDDLDLGNLMQVPEPASCSNAENPVKRSSPATSESGNKSNSPTTDVSSGTATAAQQPLSTDDEEAKRQARMARNRENAFLSRQRKKQQMAILQQQCNQYKLQQVQMTTLIQRLCAENNLLRHHMATACQKAGTPIPLVPSAMAAHNAMLMQVQQKRMMAAMPAPVQPAPGLAPIKTQMPVPPAVQPPPQQPSRKRARTVGGASAAFLALFSIFMFVSPLVAPGQRAVTIDNAGQSMLPGPLRLEALPSAASFEHHGRALQAIDGSYNEDLTLSEMMNETMEALLADSDSKKAVEDEALQRLQELAPAAVLLDATESSNSLLEAPHGFPLLAEPLFKGAGLQAPSVCEKVFELDASKLPHSVRNRRSIEKYIMQSYGFKGRSLLGPDSLPALDSAEQEKQLATIGESVVDATLQAEEAEGVLVPANHWASQEPLLVSVLLPANESNDTTLGGSKFNVVDKVFVTLLTPALNSQATRFVTYSCGLNKPILV